MGKGVDWEQSPQLPWPCSGAQLVTSTPSSAYNGVDDINHLGLSAGVLVYKVMAWARVARDFGNACCCRERDPHPPADHCACSPFC